MDSLPRPYDPHQRTQALGLATSIWSRRLKDPNCNSRGLQMGASAGGGICGLWVACGRAGCCRENRRENQTSVNRGKWW